MRTTLAVTGRRRAYLLPRPEQLPPVEEAPVRLPMRDRERSAEYTDFGASHGWRGRDRKLAARRIARRTHPRNAH